MVSKKEWYATQADPTQHKFSNEIQRLTEKYAAKGKDFTETEQYRGYKGYLDPHPITGAGGIVSTKGGGLGAIRENDPVLSAGSQASQLARENLLYQPGGIGRRTNLTAEDIKGINIPLVREGLSPDDYFRFNQMLYSPNIEEYEEARPISSGKSLRDIVTMVTPAKYLAAGATKFKDTVSDLPDIISSVPGDIMGSEMVESIKEDWADRKKGRGIAGFVEDILTTVGIGNTKKTNEFITKKTDNNTKTQDSSSDAAILEDLIDTPLETDTEIKTNMMEIKDDKVKVIKLHELTDLKTKRDQLFKKITQGNNTQGDYLEWEATVAKINELEEGKLQDMKEGGVASLATGGLLEKERVQQSFSPLGQSVNYGISSLGGLGTLFGQGGPRQHPIRPRIPHVQQPFNQDPWGIKPMGEQITGFGETLGGFGETLGGYGEQIGGFGEQLGGYEDVLGGYGQDISSFKETMGGFGNQFENINNKLTSMEEGIASLSDKIGTTQGNTQPQGRPNFGYGFNAYSPWMFGGFGRGRYG
jgi:hypothetical protein